MKHPLVAIATDQRRRVFLTLLVVTVLLMLALNILGASLRTEEAPMGIISFEFAGTVQRAQEIVDSWDSTARTWAGFNLGLDYLFMIAYSTTIALGIVWLTEARSSVRWIVSAAVFLAWGQWLAAGLDALENAALMASLIQPPAAPFPQIAWWSAALKFSLVGIGILYILIKLVQRR